MTIPTFKTLVGFSLGTFLIVMLVVFTVPESTSGSVEDRQAAERGKLVFEKYGCFVCHGNEGSGGVKNKNSATGGVVTALTYTSRAHKVGALKERIIQGPVPVKKAGQVASRARAARRWVVMSASGWFTTAFPERFRKCPRMRAAFRSDRI